MRRALWALLLLATLCPPAHAQTTPPPPTSPKSAPTTTGGDVIWYGKAPPGWGGVVTRTKLLAPGIGWAERAGRLYWTNDNGANWKDITPPGEGAIVGIFFLDPSKGWATIDRTDTSATTKFDVVSTDVVSTSDAGATWSRRATISLRIKDYELPTDPDRPTDDDFPNAAPTRSALRILFMAG
jgi:hypothetical protein